MPSLSLLHGDTYLTSKLPPPCSTDYSSCTGTWWVVPLPCYVCQLPPAPLPPFPSLAPGVLDGCSFYHLGWGGRADTTAACASTSSQPRPTTAWAPHYRTLPQAGRQAWQKAVLVAVCHSHLAAASNQSTTHRLPALHMTPPALLHRAPLPSPPPLMGDRWDMWWRRSSGREQDGAA